MQITDSPGKGIVELAQIEQGLRVFSTFHFFCHANIPPVHVSSIIYNSFLGLRQDCLINIYAMILSFPLYEIPSIIQIQLLYSHFSYKGEY